MTVHSLLTTNAIDLKSYSHHFTTAVTVVQGDSALVVIDTGFPEQEAGEGLVHLLGQRGIDPLDVDLVLNTHYHIDHVGGNHLFKNATIVMSGAEYRYQSQWYDDYTESGDRVGFVLKSFPRLNSREAVKLVEFLDVVRSRFVREGTPGYMDRVRFTEEHPPLPEWIEVLHTPGHTPHHLSFRIGESPLSAIVAGDIVAVRGSYLRGKANLIEVYTDYDAAVGSMALIRAKAAELPTIICPSHEEPFYARDGRQVEHNPFTL
jgi:glyoxylase-like metal-dependent hydrolase (beta-lactamase superfamily II)